MRTTRSRGDTSGAGSKRKEIQIMTPPGSTIHFRSNWREEQHGAIERGSRLTLDFDKSRLPDSFAQWRGAEFGDIVALCRFHPRGDLVTGSVVAPIRNGEPGTVVGPVTHPLEFAVPSDATKAEIWFHGSYQTTSRSDNWDSRFGANYWFDIGGPEPRISGHPVSYRNGAVARPDVVNVLEHTATKINAFPRPQNGGSPGRTNLQTALTVLAWV